MILNYNEYFHMYEDGGDPLHDSKLNKFDENYVKITGDGFIECNKDSYIQPFESPDGKYWIRYQKIDHSFSIDLKTKKQILIDELEEKKYSRYSYEKAVNELFDKDGKYFNIIGSNNRVVNRTELTQEEYDKIVEYYRDEFIGEKPEFTMIKQKIENSIMDDPIFNHVPTKEFPYELEISGDASTYYSKFFKSSADMFCFWHKMMYIDVIDQKFIDTYFVDRR